MQKKLFLTIERIEDSSRFEKNYFLVELINCTLVELINYFFSGAYIIDEIAQTYI
jgi:hypothetical protein